jgi:hypothetical protein
MKMDRINQKNKGSGLVGDLFSLTDKNENERI